MVLYTLLLGVEEVKWSEVPHYLRLSSLEVKSGSDMVLALYERTFERQVDAYPK